MEGSAYDQGSADDTRFQYEVIRNLSDSVKTLSESVGQQTQVLHGVLNQQIGWVVVAAAAVWAAITGKVQLG